MTNVEDPAYDQTWVDNGTILRNGIRLYMGYGGLLLEPVITCRSPFHITLPIIIGTAGAGYGYNESLPEDFDHYCWRDDAQAFFVL